MKKYAFVYAIAATALIGCRAEPRRPASTAIDDAVTVAAGAESAGDVITAETLREDVAYLADDGLAGRGPATEGDELARAYLADQMMQLGIEPAFGDQWEQPFGIVGITADVPKTWTFNSAEKSETLHFWDDFIAASGVQEETAAIDDAELVFVGHGIEAPEHDWNDFKNVDVSGKVLLIMNNDPDWDAELFEGERRLYYGRWDYKYEKAAELGAAGAIIIHTTPSAGYPYQVVQTSWTGEQFELPAEGKGRSPVEAWVTDDAARRLMALGGQDLDALREAARSKDFEPVVLGIGTSIRLRNKLSHVETANVGGLLRGSDPELADEVVVFTAHHDHLGTGEPDDSGDTIYNGARDNGAGCASILGVARAFAALPEPPRRSVLFLFVAAEEQGLLGSEYYAQNPTFHPGRIAANVNMDGGNIWGRTKDMTYIGYGKSSLDAVADAIAAHQGRHVKGDQFPDRGYFYRSDQFNFAKIGVPAIYVDEGTETIGRPDGWGKEQIDAWTEINYHQPSDELEASWDFGGMVEDARFAFWAGLAIADADAMPTWNPGDEFEAARLAALAELGP